MNGFTVLGKVFASGSKQIVVRWFWWQMAREMTGSKRLGQVVLRAFGALLVAWFAGGTLWALGWIWYVAPAVWFVLVGILAEVSVDDNEPLPSPTEEGWSEEEVAGQELVVEKGRIGKAPVVKIHDPNNPHHTHLVWLDPKAKAKGA